MSRVNHKILTMVRLSLVAAMYVVLTIFNPFSYDAIQFRISEILVFLCFYRKDYSIGLILGCFIANLFSPMMLYDITFGTFATILAVVCIMFSKNIYIASLFPVVFNGVIVALELYFAFKEPFLLSMGSVALGEAVVMVVGIIAFKLLERNEGFMKMIDANQNYPKFAKES